MRIKADSILLIISYLGQIMGGACWRLPGGHGAWICSVQLGETPVLQ